jgi:hypothetical protein
VDTVGVRTGGELGGVTGGRLGFGTETAGTVDVGTETVGAVTVGVGTEMVGTVVVGTESVGVDTEGTETDGTVKAVLECGWMPTRRTAIAARMTLSATLAPSRNQPPNGFTVRTRWPLQPPRIVD